MEKSIWCCQKMAGGCPQSMERSLYFYTRGVMLMSIVDLITVISFALTCFTVGYQLGRSSKKAEK